MNLLANEVSREVVFFHHGNLLLVGFIFEDVKLIFSYHISFLFKFKMNLSWDKFLGFKVFMVKLEEIVLDSGESLLVKHLSQAHHSVVFFLDFIFLFLGPLVDMDQVEQLDRNGNQIGLDQNEEFRMNLGVISSVEPDDVTEIYYQGDTEVDAPSCVRALSKQGILHLADVVDECKGHHESNDDH